VKDFAIFVSVTENYVHLFNALYNSVELFGIGEYAEFVVMHDSIPQLYIEYMNKKTNELSTKIRFVKIEIEKGDEDLGKAMVAKFYRYKIMSEIGKQYKSILFLDSDIFFSSGIREYFEIASQTNLVVATNDNVCRQYKTNPELGTCPTWADDKTSFFEKDLFDGKFICNVPTFIDINKYGHVFYDVFQHRRKLGMDKTWPFGGDLETMNLVMLKHHLKERVLILSSHLWTGVHHTYFRTNVGVKRWTPSVASQISDPQYKNEFMFMSETCEHVRAFHGRDWTTEKSESNFKQNAIPKIIQQSEGRFDGAELEKAKKKRENVFDLIQSYFLFLQFDCYVKVDEVIKTCQFGQDKYDYMKKRRADLESIVKTFKGN